MQNRLYNFVTMLNKCDCWIDENVKRDKTIDTTEFVTMLNK